MRKLIGVICFGMLSGVLFSIDISPPEQWEGPEMIQVYSGPELSELVQVLLETYRQDHPAFRYEQHMFNSGDQEIELAPGQIAFLTKRELDLPGTRELRMVPLGRDIYIPVINAGNPFAEEIRSRGFSPADFSEVFLSQKPVGWGNLLENGSSSAINLYCPPSASFREYFSSFMNMDPAACAEIIKEKEADVIQSVRNDPFSIGFCTYSELAKLEQEGKSGDFLLLPIDMNRNSQIDPLENIYGSASELLRGIWIGKYPHDLISRIYAVAIPGSLRESQLALLEWIAADGQEMVSRFGYTALYDTERAAVLAGLKTTEFRHPESRKLDGLTYALVLILCIFFGIFLIFYLAQFLINRSRKRNQEAEQLIARPLLPATENIPGGYYYDRSHTWAYVERDGGIRIGIDSFLKDVSGSITGVRMKHPGDMVERGQPLLTLVQNGKKMEVRSPLSGTITAHNMALQESPSKLSSAPYSEGWVYLIEPSNWLEESEFLSRAQSYREWIKKEAERLKDFISGILSGLNQREVVFQEGGEVYAGILEDLGPAAWEEFQTSFL